MMRTPVAILPMLVLALAPVCTFAAEPATPVADAVAREARRLAATPDDDRAPHGWDAVRAIAPGTTVTVTTASETLQRTFVTADDRSVVLIDLAAIPTPAREFLEQFTAVYVQQLARAAGGAHVAVASLDFTSGGVFENGQKVADVHLVFRTIPVADVMRVTARGDRHGSVPATIAGAAVGVVLGVRMAMGLGMSVRCQPNCGEVEAAMVASSVGLPVGLAFALYRATSHVSVREIYQR